MIKAKPYKDLNKLPALTISFWVMKICATTLGETFGDLLSMTMHIGYALSSCILLMVFFASLFVQLLGKKFHPVIYWFVILSTSTAGTTISDYMDRTLNLGYAMGSCILAGMLLLVLFIWKQKEKSISVTHIKSVRGEIFYWTAILFSNTLGTALGDFLADNSGLGFLGGAMLIGGLLSLLALAHYFTKISTLVLFWAAFVLTRPFGATFGDLLTKPLQSGGLNLGTLGSSAVLFSILAIWVAWSVKKVKRES